MFSTSYESWAVAPESARFAIDCKFSGLHHMSPGHTSGHDRVLGPAAIVEDYLIVSCRLSPGVDVGKRPSGKGHHPRRPKNVPPLLAAPLLRPGDPRNRASSRGSSEPMDCRCPVRK